MKNIFIELTDSDDTKILLNVLHIAWVEPNKTGAVKKSNLVNYSMSRKVKESYDDIKSMIGSLDYPQ